MSNLHTYREQGYLVLEEGLAHPRQFRLAELALNNNYLRTKPNQSSSLMKLLTSKDIMSSVGLILTTDSDADHKIEIQFVDQSCLVQSNDFYHSGIAPFLGIEDNPNHTTLVIVLNAKEKVQPLNILPKDLSDTFRTNPFIPVPESLIEPLVPNHSSFFISPELFWKTKPSLEVNPHSLLIVRYSSVALY